MADNTASAPKSPAGPGEAPGLLGADIVMPLQADDEVVAELSSWRRWIILFVVCWMALPLTFVSTAIMAATIEVAEGLGTSPTSITTANAGVLVSMALSALLWLPISVIIGRRSAYLLVGVVLLLCSVGCALANSLPLFTTLWIISGTTGPFFLVAGQTILSDIFEPVSYSTHVAASLLED